MGWFDVLPYAGIPVLAVLFLVMLAGLCLRRSRLRLKHERHQVQSVSRCQCCGYDLHGLDLPRCPECGVLKGFRVPMEALGLTEEDVRALHRRKRVGTVPGDDPEQDQAESRLAE